MTVPTTVHLHASHGPCKTVCGIACDQVDVAYRGLDPERVTCPPCKDDLRRKDKS